LVEGYPRSRRNSGNVLSCCFGRCNVKSDAVGHKRRTFSFSESASKFLRGRRTGCVHPKSWLDGAVCGACHDGVTHVARPNLEHDLEHKMSRWALSKLDAVALPVMLAFRAARRAVRPVGHCKVDGLSIAIRISTPNEHHRAETYATKEPETIEWLRGNLRDGDVFYDVGANIGLYSLYAAKLRPGCRVFAFEPESHNFGSLCGNLLLNRVENVTPCFFPLSSHETFAPFYVYDLRAGGALHSLG
jgi:hypothetical protein